MRQDFYSVLGVAPTASAEEIRQAFRQRARQYHPDANPGDPTADERFKALNEAHRVLSTPQLRAAYDAALRRLRPSQFPGRAADPHSFEGGASVETRATPPLSPANASPAPQTPKLRLNVSLGQRTLGALREPTRFFALSELGAASQQAVIDPLPLDLALLIDRSGSMRGAPIFAAKQCVRDLLDTLRTDDLLTLIFFDDRPELVTDGEAVQGRAGIEHALDRITTQGGTVISRGLAAALDRLAPRQGHARATSLLLITDGRTYGDDDACLELAARAREMGVSITTIGIGEEWNRTLLDRVAAISGGSSHFVERPLELQATFEPVVRRLRAMLATDMRVTFEPAPGVRITRATRVAPDIAEAFGVPTEGVVALLSAPPTPVTVELGALVGRADQESAVALWEALLDPDELTPRNGMYTLGRLTASYISPQPTGPLVERLETPLHVRAEAQSAPAALEPDVRLALELVTAYRLQAQADALKSAGQAADAVARMRTAALRLKSLGHDRLAVEAEQAAQALDAPPQAAPNAGVTETLRVKYSTKNLGVFHRLRQRVRIR